MKKTKVIFNDHIITKEIKIGNDIVEHVEEYVYLGQLVTMKSGKTDEIRRRIEAGWGAFGNISI